MDQSKPVRHNVPLSSDTRLVLMRDVDGELVLRALSADIRGRRVFLTPKCRADVEEFAELVCAMTDRLEAGSLSIEVGERRVVVRVDGQMVGWIEAKPFGELAWRFLSDAAGSPDDPLPAHLAEAWDWVQRGFVRREPEALEAA